MKRRKFQVLASVVVTVEISDPDVLERITGLKGNEWREKFYAFSTVQEIIEHLAYNALVNEVHNAQALDGWADLGLGAALMSVDRDSVIFEDFVELPS